MIGFTVIALVLVGGVGVGGADDAQKAPPAATWSMNATVIEACSCPMFCQCYFNVKPAGHEGHGAHAEHAGAEHFCRFNNAYRVNRGDYGGVKLDGARFWLYGDLGGDFSKGQMDWVVLTFDPSVTPAQREGIKQVAGQLFPVKWNSFAVGPDAKIDWVADKDRASAKLDGGRVAEVALKRFPGNTEDPVVIQNLKYWGSQRNDGFVLMPNEVQALRAAPEGRTAYEFKGTNGFMITFDIGSGEAKK
jgi:hypothetical protein